MGQTPGARPSPDLGFDWIGPAGGAAVPSSARGPHDEMSKSTPSVKPIDFDRTVSRNSAFGRRLPSDRRQE